MRVIKGVYENGVVALLEELDSAERRDVMVLVPEGDDAPAWRALEFAGMLSDLTPEEDAAFAEALRRPLRFARSEAA